MAETEQEPIDAFTHSFFHSGNKYFLNAFSVAGIMWIQLVTKISTVPTVMEFMTMETMAGLL